MSERDDAAGAALLIMIAIIVGGGSLLFYVLSIFPTIVMLAVGAAAVGLITLIKKVYRRVSAT